MTYTDTIVAHLDKHRAMILPLARQCLRAGFSLTMVKGGTETATAFIAETGDFEPAYAIARDHADPADAAMVIKLFERPLTGTTYNQSGKSNINLIFLQGSAREFFRGMPKIVAQIRQVLVENFDNQAIFDLIDFGADYLDGTTYPFGYTIHAFGRPIFDGHLHGRVLRVGILDPTAWVRLGLFFVKGADALALSLRNPFDILALLDTLQASLRHLATSYAERGLTIEAHALGQKVFSCGAGVRSNLMTDRFGPTAIHLEAIFRMLSSALQAAKEAASR